LTLQSLQRIGSPPIGSGMVFAVPFVNEAKTRSHPMRKFSFVLIGMIVSTAVSAASFEKVDSDASGAISKSEYIEAVRESHTYRFWDRDDNSFIDAREFEEAGITGDFTARDADVDKFLEATEFYDAVFAGYDSDEDGYWSNSEWNRASADGFFDAHPPP
jgi:hypothetical protein